jgi:hypothetical protein
MKRYWDEQGKVVEVDQPGGKIGEAGGEGTVYLVPNANEVAKIWTRLHDLLADPSTAASARKRLANKYAKLPAMLEFGQRNPAIYKFCAWPKRLLFASGTLVGFTMERLPADAFEIRRLCNIELKTSLLGRCNAFSVLAKVALNVSHLVAELNRIGVYVGDFNLPNIRVNPDAVVGFIDTDGFEFSHRGQRYKNDAIMDVFRAPELWRDPNLIFTEQQDAFGLAVLLFQLFFQETMPYDSWANGAMIESQEQVTLRGKYIFEQGNKVKEATPSLSIVSREIQGFFRSAFTANTRPTAAQWFQALQKQLAALQQCGHSVRHQWPQDAAAACPWCDIHRNFGVDYFLSSANPGAAPAGGPQTPKAAVTQFIRQATTAAAAPVPMPQAVAPQLSRVASKSTIAPTKKNAWPPFLGLIAVLAAIIWGVRNCQPSTHMQTTQAPPETLLVDSARALLQAAAPDSVAFARVESTLTAANSGSNAEILAQAQRVPGSLQNSAFAGMQSNRSAVQTGIELNARALTAFNKNHDARTAFSYQVLALQAHPFNPEILGNYAIYTLASAQVSANLPFPDSPAEQARAATIAALTMRQASSTGRTADWATLAATYAQEGDQEKAAQALFVALAIAPDAATRCYSALYSVAHVYGDALKPATEQMIARVAEQKLSRAPACRFPVDWTLPASQQKFETSGKLTVNGMNPVRTGFSIAQFAEAFQITAAHLNCDQAQLGIQNNIRICDMASNFLGDVVGAVLIDESQVVGITIRDPRITTPSGVHVGGSASSITAAYAGKYEIKAPALNQVRVLGTGADAQFLLQFWIGADDTIVQLGSYLGAAFATQETPTPLASELSEATSETQSDVEQVTVVPGGPYTLEFSLQQASAELVLPNESRAAEYTFRIIPLGGRVRVNVVASDGVFSYETSSGAGRDLCRLGVWKRVNIDNISAQSVRVSVLRSTSPCG